MAGDQDRADRSFCLRMRRRTMTLHLRGPQFFFARRHAVAGGPAAERSRSLQWNEHAFRLLVVAGVGGRWERSRSSNRHLDRANNTIESLLAASSCGTETFPGWNHPKRRGVMSTIPMSVTTPVPTTVRDSRAQPAPTVELLDRFLTRPMFFLAFGFLLLSAGLIHRMGHDDQTPFEHAVILWGLVGLWPVFVCEGMLRLVVCRRPGTGGWQRLAIFLAVCLFPPFRLGGRAYANPEQLWLPGLGWNTVGSHLQARLERLFCVPMVITALLVLPLLALEYFWLEAVRAHFGLSLLLDIGTSVI